MKTDEDNIGQNLPTRLDKVITTGKCVQARADNQTQNESCQHVDEGTSLWNKVSSLLVGLSALTSLTATSSTPFMRALYTTPNPPSPSLHFLFSEVRHMLISSLHHHQRLSSMYQQRHVHWSSTVNTAATRQCDR